MEILSNGVKKPETGDRGSVFFPALEDNCDYLNDHTHDGSLGEPIPATNISPVTQSVSSGSWSAVSGGVYRQLLTVPNGKNYDDVFISFRESVTKQPMLLGLEKASATTYYVHINDNSLSLIASYRS